MSDSTTPQLARLNAVFELQKHAYSRSPNSSARERKQHLASLLKAIERHETKLIDAAPIFFRN